MGSITLQLSRGGWGGIVESRSLSWLDRSCVGNEKYTLLLTINLTAFYRPSIWVVVVATDAERIAPKAEFEFLGKV